MSKVSYSDLFTENVTEIASDKLLSELHELLLSIIAFPLMGSTDVSPSFVRRYGENLRKFPISSFVIIYRYDESTDTVEFLALPYGSSVR